MALRAAATAAALGGGGGRPQSAAASTLGLSSMGFRHASSHALSSTARTVRSVGFPPLDARSWYTTCTNEIGAPCARALGSLPGRKCASDDDAYTFSNDTKKQKKETTKIQKKKKRSMRVQPGRWGKKMLSPTV